MLTFGKRILLTLVVLVACVGCDQVTKSLAQNLLPEHEVWSFLGDSFRLQLAYNHGVFLSLGAGLPEALRAVIFSAMVGAMLLALLAYMLLTKTLSRLELLAFSLLVAGGAGNLIDRLVYGYVIDFMNIGIGPLRTGIFNVADIAVSVGVFLLVIGGFYESKSTQ